MFTKLITPLIILCLAAGGVQAGAVPLTLRDAVDRALEENQRVKAAAHAAEAAGFAASAATARYYPSLAFEEAFTASNAPTQTFMMKLDEGRFTQGDFQINRLNSPATTHDFRTALTVQQPLFVPALVAMRELAQRGEEKQRHALAGTRQETAFRVFRTYLDVQRSRSRIAAAELAVADARENLRLAQVRTAAEVGLRSDELRARTHVAAMEQLAITARNDRAIALLQLAHAIGAKDGESIDVDGSIPRLTPPPGLDALVAAALEHRDDLKAVRSEKDRADAAIRLARSEYLPAVGAFASYQLNGRDAPFTADNNAWSAGVNLHWQLFDGLRSSRDQSRAIAERASAAEMVEATAREIRLQVQESLLRREEASRRREVARSSVRDAEETVRLLTKRFENSLASMTDLLDAQTALNQARAFLVDAEADEALASGRVYHVAGLFLKEIRK